jgi:hypothetical protein
VTWMWGYTGCPHVGCPREGGQGVVPWWPCNKGRAPNGAVQRSPHGHEGDILAPRCAHGRRSRRHAATVFSAGGLSQHHGGQQQCTGKIGQPMACAHMGGATALSIDEN